MIYLDITRLINRLEQATPTGIDRVELEYAKNILENGCLFCCQKGNDLFQVPRFLAKKLVDYLEKRWKSGGTEDCEFISRIRDWMNTLRNSGEQRQKKKQILFLEKVATRSYKKRYGLVRKEGEAIQEIVPYLPKYLVVLLVILTPVLLSKILNMKGDLIRGSVCWPKIFNEIWYLNVGHSGLEKKGFLYSLSKYSGLKIAIYLHDLLPISHKHLFAKGTDKIHKIRMNNIALYSDLIIANSQFTKDSFQKLYAPKQRVEVLEIGVSQHLLKVDQDKECKRSGFVSIGTIEPRKNYLWLAENWDALCKIYPDYMNGEKLTIFGKIGWLPQDQVNKLQSLESKGSLQLVSDADDLTIQKALLSARAYVTAAEVEGWGMPLAESLSLGTPVIASDVPAHREVTCNKAVFFPYNDFSTFEKAILNCYKREEYIQMISQVENFEPWSWSIHFNSLKLLLSEDDQTPLVKLN